MNYKILLLTILTILIFAASILILVHWPNAETVRNSIFGGGSGFSHGVGR